MSLGGPHSSAAWSGISPSVRSSDDYRSPHTAAGRLRQGCERVLLWAVAEQWLEKELGTKRSSVDHFLIKKFWVWKVYLNGVLHVGVDFFFGETRKSEWSTDGLQEPCSRKPGPVVTGLYPSSAVLHKGIPCPLSAPPPNMVPAACSIFLEVWLTCCLMPLLKVSLWYVLTDRYSGKQHRGQSTEYDPAGELSVVLSVYPGPFTPGRHWCASSRHRLVEMGSYSICSFPLYCWWWV